MNKIFDVKEYKLILHVIIFFYLYNDKSEDILRVNIFNAINNKKGVYYKKSVYYKNLYNDNTTNFRRRLYLIIKNI